MARKNKKFTKKVKDDAVLSPNKFDVLNVLTDEEEKDKDAVDDSNEDQPCRVCAVNVSIETDGLQCDRCDAWVHSEKDCSDLNKTDFRFMKKCNNPAIQYICLVCRDIEDAYVKPRDAVVRDAVAKNSAKLDSFGESVAQLQKQNKEITTMIKNKCNTNDTENFKKHVSEVMKSQKDNDIRGRNVILYNIPESSQKSTPAQAVLEDLQNVKNVLNFVCPSFDTSGIDSKSVSRCGAKREPTTDIPTPKPRPIKVVLSNNSEVIMIRKNARKLKDNDGLKHVGISEDKSYHERMEDKKLRSELTKRRNDNEDVIIYETVNGKKVILRSELAKYKNNVNGDEAPNAQSQAKGNSTPKH